MNIKTLALAIVAMGTATLGLAAYDQQRDYSEIKDFIKEQQKEITLRGKAGGHLELGGDIRFKWQNRNQKLQDKQQFSIGSDAPSTDTFTTEFNLLADYATENTWGGAKVEFKNQAGVSTVKTADTNPKSANTTVKLQKALFGMNILEEGSSRLDIDMGRDRGYNLFDSKVQFNNYFDGAWLKYSNSFEDIGDFYVRAGGLVGNSERQNYAWVGETGLLDIVNTGIYAKYSYAHWAFAGNKYFPKFQNSQFTAGWKFNNEWMVTVPAKVYGAFLINHDAKKYSSLDNHKYNKAWYAGISVGELAKAGDWAVNFDWQVVEPQAVQGSEVSGIGNGNAQSSTLAFDHTTSPVDSDSTPPTNLGNANYKGYEIDVAYAVTDSLTIAMEWDSTHSARQSVGGKNNYKKFELEAIYAF
ncbi:MAG: hypothetical protein ACQEP8_03905 [Chlamydiota bacterium]